MLELKIRLQDDFDQAINSYHDELKKFNNWEDYKDWLKLIIKNDNIILKLSIKEIVN